MDVLEHISPDEIDNFLKRLSEMGKDYIISIANHSDSPTGVELHLICEPLEWWEEKLSKYFTDINIISSEKVIFVLEMCKK